jgi:hypothetical protein
VQFSGVDFLGVDGTSASYECKSGCTENVSVDFGCSLGR